MKGPKKSRRIERRGRKAGDGILQNIAPRSSLLEKRMMLTFGRTHRNGVSAMLRWIKNLQSMSRYLEDCRKELDGQAVRDAEPVQISEADHKLIDEIMSGIGCKVIDGKRISIKALRYWFERRQFEKNTNEIREFFHAEVDEALTALDSEWFQKVAAAIKLEKDASPLFPLHNALLSIAGAPSIRRSAVVYPEGSIGGILKNQAPQYTIGEVCGILEKQRKRPASQNDSEWKREVRRACQQIGFPLLPSKSGPMPKNS